MALVLGRLIRTGKLSLTRRIAVAGSCVKEPHYVETIIGAPLADILKGQIDNVEHTRIINGIRLSAINLQLLIPLEHSAQRCV